MITMSFMVTPGGSYPLDFLTDDTQATLESIIINGQSIETYQLVSRESRSPGMYYLELLNQADSSPVAMFQINAAEKWAETFVADPEFSEEITITMAFTEPKPQDAEKTEVKKTS